MTADRHDGTHELCPDDQRLLDALVDNGFDTAALEALSPADKQRAETIMTLFDLLEDYPVDDADDTLVHATLARVDRTEDDRAARMTFDATEPAGPRSRFRIPDFLSVAAVILIGTSIVWPLSNHLRQRSIDSGCANNLRRMALAFDQYAGDYEGMMPTAQAGLFGAWSPTARNVVNLNPLVKGGYCERDHLSCPGHASHEGHYGESYSYRWQTEGPMTWGANRLTLVLGDRNPLVDAARDGRTMPALSMSINHGGRGQFVLGTDGAWIWLDQPVIGGNDNIWLPTNVYFLRAGDKPADKDDTFLVH